MRKKILIFGVIVLIIGILLYAYGSNHYNYYNNDVDRGFIEISNNNDNPNAEEEMEYGQNVSYVGIIGIILSLILIIAGLILKE